jgi:hypothetical protein
MITKEQIQAEATKLGLTLNETEIEQLVKDQKLPVKADDDEKLLKELGGNKTAWEMIKELRKENAEKRVLAKKAEDKLAQIEKDKKKAQDDEDLAKGNYEKLLKEANDKVSQYEPIISEYEADIKIRREKVKTKLGDKWIDSFSAVKISELEALADKLETVKVNVNSTNHKQDKPEEDKPLINYKTMTN